MNQETGSGDNESVTEPGAGKESRRCVTNGHRMPKHDIIGIVMGIPVFLLGLCALAGWPGVPWVGVALLLISVGLFIPGKVYERRAARAIGFVALSLATAASVTCVVVIGIGVGIYYVSKSDPGAWWAWGVLVLIGGGGLLALMLALLCTWVLLRKLRPKPAHAAVGITAGIAVGLVNVLVVYLVYVQE